MNKTLIWIAILVVIILGAGGAYVYMGSNQQPAANNQQQSQNQNPIQNQIVSYTITEIPYYGFYNAARMSDVAGALYSITQYWGDSNLKPLDIENKFPSATNPQFSDLQNYLQARGYTASVDNFASVNDLAKYINSQAKQPIFLFQKTHSNQKNGELPARIVVGIDDSKQVVIVNDYWLGNNYEVSYNEFFKLRDNGQRGLIIKPKVAFANKASAGSNNLTITNEERQMFDDFLSMYNNKLFSDSARSTSDYINSKFINDSTFAGMPQSFKMFTYVWLGRAYTLQKNYALAKSALEKGSSYNQNLDKPNGKWPASILTKSGQYANIPYEWGRYYEATNNISLAITNYRKALDINPQITAAKLRLEALSK